MDNLGKKVGFLKGLMEGMSFDSSSANGKLMSGIVDRLRRATEFPALSE